MAKYKSQIALASATATDVHTAGQNEELLVIRIVADGTTTAQTMTFYKQVSAVDYELVHVEIPEVASVGAGAGSPFQTQVVVPECYLANTNKIRVKSENAEAFNIFVVTRDEI